MLLVVVVVVSTTADCAAKADGDGDGYKFLEEDDGKEEIDTNPATPSTPPPTKHPHSNRRNIIGNIVTALRIASI